MDQIDKKKYYLDFAGFMSIGIFSLGYVVFIRLFAEIHIQFPFLDFPVFLGEILLLLCLSFFFAKGGRCPQKIEKKYSWVIICYFSFVIIKALYGYSQWGPLAFRHSALFYYPAFIILAYSFYQKKFFDSEKTILYLSAILLLFIGRNFYDFWVFTCFSLAFILFYVQIDKKLKYLMLAILILVTPYREFFATSRMMMVANVLAVAYLAVGFYFILRIKRSIRIIILMAGIILIIGGTIRFSDKNAIKSIVNINRIVEAFKENDVEVEILLRENRVMGFGEIRTYNLEYALARNPKNTLASEKLSGSRKVRVRVYNPEHALASEKLSHSRKVKLNHPEYALALEKLSDFRKVKGNEAKERMRPLRNLPVAYANVLFRLFIWRDMLVELIEEKPVFGFDFGKPLRPRSLLALDWAAIPLAHDGWIAVHNSYLHMIYRAGIVGVLAIGAIFTILFQMIKKSIRCRSFIGILLCGIIINCFVAANFLLIFELPYTAIPIWSLFGLAYAYTKDLKLEKIESEARK